MVMNPHISVTIWDAVCVSHSWFQTKEKWDIRKKLNHSENDLEGSSRKKKKENEVSWVARESKVFEF